MNVVFVAPVRTLLFLTFLSTSAFAEPLHALIFAGGATAADAQAALASFKAELANQVDNAVKLPAGEPRVVESAKLPGLKPGFHIVTLGTCKDPAPVLAALKAIYPGVYARPLTGDVGPERCPTLVEGVEVGPLEPPVKVGPLVLSAFLTTETSKDERGRDTTSSRLGFVLTEKASGLVKDLLTLDGDTVERVGDGPAGWEYESCMSGLTPTKNGFTVTRTCTSERTGCDGGERAIPKAWSEVLKVTVAGTQLESGETKKNISSKETCR